MRQNPPVVCVDIIGFRLILFTFGSSSTPDSAYRWPVILNVHPPRVSQSTTLVHYRLITYLRNAISGSLLRRHVPRPFGHHSAHERGKTFHNIYIRSYLPTMVSRYLGLVDGLVSYLLLLQKTGSDREHFLYRLPLGQFFVPPVSSSALTYPHSTDTKSLTSQVQGSSSQGRCQESAGSQLPRSTE